MSELVVIIALLSASLATFGGLLRRHRARRPTQRRLRELEPLIAPWLERGSGETSRR